MPRVVKKVCLLPYHPSSFGFEHRSAVYLTASEAVRGIMLIYSPVRSSSLSEGYSSLIMPDLPISSYVLLYHSDHHALLGIVSAIAHTLCTEYE